MVRFQPSIRPAESNVKIPRGRVSTRPRANETFAAAVGSQAAPQWRQNRSPGSIGLSQWDHRDGNGKGYSVWRSTNQIMGRSPSQPESAKQSGL